MGSQIRTEKDDDVLTIGKNTGNTSSEEVNEESETSTENVNENEEVKESEEDYSEDEEE